MYLRDPAYRKCITGLPGNLCHQNNRHHPYKTIAILENTLNQQAATRPVPLKQEACPKNTG
jgi:hypothetical protein